MQAVELGSELVLLPGLYSMVPAFKGIMESLTGKLGLGVMARKNPMAKWDSRHANAAFDRMRNKSSDTATEGGELEAKSRPMTMAARL